MQMVAAQATATATAATAAALHLLAAALKCRHACMAPAALWLLFRAKAWLCLAWTLFSKSPTHCAWMTTLVMASTTTAQAAAAASDHDPNPTPCIKGGSTALRQPHHRPQQQQRQERDRLQQPLLQPQWLTLRSNKLPLRVRPRSSSPPPLPPPRPPLALLLLPLPLPVHPRQLLPQGWRVLRTTFFAHMRLPAPRLSRLLAFHSTWSPCHTTHAGSVSRHQRATCSSSPCPRTSLSLHRRLLPPCKLEPAPRPPSHCPLSPAPLAQGYMAPATMSTSPSSRAGPSRRESQPGAILPLRWLQRFRAPRPLPPHRLPPPLLAVHSPCTRRCGCRLIHTRHRPGP